MSTNINLLEALSQILFSATHKQFPVTSLVVSHAVWVPSTLGPQRLQGPGGDSCWGQQRSLASAQEEAPERTLSPLCSAFFPLHWAPRATDGFSVPGKDTGEQGACWESCLDAAGCGKLRWAGSRQSLPRCEHVRRGNTLLLLRPKPTAPSPGRPCPPPAQTSHCALIYPASSHLISFTQVSFMLSVLGAIWFRTTVTTFTAYKIGHTHARTCVYVHTCVSFMTISAAGNR